MDIYILNVTVLHYDSFSELSWTNAYKSITKAMSMVHSEVEAYAADCLEWDNCAPSDRYMVNMYGECKEKKVIITLEKAKLNEL